MAQGARQASLGLLVILLALGCSTTSRHPSALCEATSLQQQPGFVLAGDAGQADYMGHCPSGTYPHPQEGNPGACTCIGDYPGALEGEEALVASATGGRGGGKKRGKAKRSGVHPNRHLGKVELPHVTGFPEGDLPRFGEEFGGFQENPLPPPPWGFPAGVKVVPSFLSWEDQHTCTTAQTTLRIINLSNSTDLAVHSATSSCFDFYMADFPDTRVPPNAVFFLNVFFLPRTLGLIDGNLTVQTSAGPVVVPLYGNGLPSPYGLEPKVSLRALVGQRIRHTVTLSNPFDWPIMVQDLQKKEDFYLSGLHKAEPCNCRMSNVKVFVSGREIAPDPDQWAGERGGLEKFSTQLVVEPGRRKVVLDIEMGHSEMGRLSASIFLRIAGQCKQEYLLIPIDLTTAWGGIFPTEDEVNFGTLTSPRQTVVRHLELANTGSKSGTLEEIRLTARDENFVQVRFRKGQVLYPGKSTVVSELTYQALVEPSGSARSLAAGKPRGPMGALAYADEWWKVGKILVRANHRNSSTMEVAYRARVVLGSVDLEPRSGTVFIVGFEPLGEALADRLASDEEVNLLRISHQVVLRNSFSCPVLVYAGYFSHDCAEAPEFPVATLIPPGGTSEPFMLHILPERVPSIPFVVSFSVATNVTEVTLRLYVVSGRMDASLPFSSDAELALGKDKEKEGAGAKGRKGKEKKGKKGQEAAAASIPAAPAPVAETSSPFGGAGQHLPQLSPTRVLDFGMVQLGRTVSRTFNISSRSPLDVPVRGIAWSSSLLTLRVDGAWHLPPKGPQDSASSDALGALGELEVSEMVDWGAGLKAQASLGPDLPLVLEAREGQGKEGWTMHRTVGEAKDPDCKYCTLFEIPGWHAAQITVVLNASKEEAGEAMLQVLTVYETMDIRVRYETVSGSVSLTPPSLAFPSLFPGKKLKLPLHASSEFQRPIRLLSMVSSDPRIIPMPQALQVTPHKETQIGSILFDPTASFPRRPNETRACSWRHHLGVPPPSTSHLRYTPKPLKGLRTSAEGNAESKGGLLGACDRLEVEWWGEITEEERASARARQEAWREMEASGATQFEASVAVDFEGLLPVLLSVAGALSLPRVADHAGPLHFLDTHVGDITRQAVRVVNPSNRPVRMQLVLDSLSERCQGTEVVCAARAESKAPCARWQEDVSRLLPDALRWWRTKEEHRQVHRLAAADEAAFFLEEGAVSELVVPSLGSATLGPISFRPSRVCRMESLAYVRNNLTFLDELQLQGEGGSGCLHFVEADENRESISLNITQEQVLTPAGAPREHPLRIEKTFHMQNTGNMHLHVSSLSLVRGGVGGRPGVCRTRGFSLEPCRGEGLSLSPGEQRRVVVAFQPDMSSLVSRLTLRADSSAGELLFPLTARLPRPLLPLLMRAQPPTALQSMVRGAALLGLAGIAAYLLHCALGQAQGAKAPWLPPLSSAATSALARRISARQKGAAHSDGLGASWSELPGDLQDSSGDALAAASAALPLRLGEEALADLLLDAEERDEAQGSPGKGGGTSPTARADFAGVGDSLDGHERAAEGLGRENGGSGETAPMLQEGAAIPGKSTSTSTEEASSALNKAAVPANKGVPSSDASSSFSQSSKSYLSLHGSDSSSCASPGSSSEEAPDAPEGTALSGVPQEATAQGGAVGKPAREVGPQVGGGELRNRQGRAPNSAPSFSSSSSSSSTSILPSSTSPSSLPVEGESTASTQGSKSKGEGGSDISPAALSANGTPGVSAEAQGRGRVGDVARQGGAASAAAAAAAGAAAGAARANAATAAAGAPAAHHNPGVKGQAGGRQHQRQGQESGAVPPSRASLGAPGSSGKDSKRPGSGAPSEPSPVSDAPSAAAGEHPKEAHHTHSPSGFEPAACPPGGAPPATKDRKGLGPVAPEAGKPLESMVDKSGAQERLHSAPALVELNSGKALSLQNGKGSPARGAPSPSHAQPQALPSHSSPPAPSSKRDALRGSPLKSSASAEAEASSPPSPHSSDVPVSRSSSAEGATGGGQGAGASAAEGSPLGPGAFSQHGSKPRFASGTPGILRVDLRQVVPQKGGSAIAFKGGEGEGAGSTADARGGSGEDKAQGVPKGFQQQQGQQQGQGQGQQGQGVQQLPSVQAELRAGSKAEHLIVSPPRGRQAPHAAQERQQQYQWQPKRQQQPRLQNPPPRQLHQQQPQQQAAQAASPQQQQPQQQVPSASQYVQKQAPRHQKLRQQQLAQQQQQQQQQQLLKKQVQGQGQSQAQGQGQGQSQAQGPGQGLTSPDKQDRMLIGPRHLHYQQHGAPSAVRQLHMQPGPLQQQQVVDHKPQQPKLQAAQVPPQQQQQQQAQQQRQQDKEEEQRQMQAQHTHTPAAHQQAPFLSQESPDGQDVLSQLVSLQGTWSDGGITSPARKAQNSLAHSGESGPRFGTGAGGSGTPFSGLHVNGGEPESALPKLPSFANIATDAVVSRADVGQAGQQPLHQQGVKVQQGTQGVQPNATWLQGPFGPSSGVPGSTSPLQLSEPLHEVTGVLSETSSAPAHLYDIWGVNHFSSIASRPRGLEGVPAGKTPLGGPSPLFGSSANPFSALGPGSSNIAAANGPAPASAFGAISSAADAHSGAAPQPLRQTLSTLTGASHSGGAPSAPQPLRQTTPIASSRSAVGSTVGPGSSFAKSPPFSSFLGGYTLFGTDTSPSSPPASSDPFAASAAALAASMVGSTLPGSPPLGPQPDPTLSLNTSPGGSLFTGGPAQAQPQPQPSPLGGALRASPSCAAKAPRTSGTGGTPGAPGVGASYDSQVWSAYGGTPEASLVPPGLPFTSFSSSSDKNQ